VRSKGESYKQAERPRVEIDMIVEQVRQKIGEERKVSDIGKLIETYQRLAADYNELSRDYEKLLGKHEAAQGSLLSWKNTAITVIVALACTLVSITLYFCSLLKRW
jgi:hypothetical protein